MSHKSAFPRIFEINLAWIIFLEILISDSNVEILEIRSDFIFGSDEENSQIMKIMKYFSSLTSWDIFDFLPLRYRRNIFRFSLIYLIKNYRFNQFSLKIAQNYQLKLRILSRQKILSLGSNYKLEDILGQNFKIEAKSANHISKWSSWHQLFILADVEVTRGQKSQKIFIHGSQNKITKIFCENSKIFKLI